MSVIFVFCTYNFNLFYLFSEKKILRNKQNVFFLFFLSASGLTFSDRAVRDRRRFKVKLRLKLFLKN